MSQCDENLQNTVIVVVIQEVHFLYHHHQHHVFNNLIITIQFMQYFQCSLFKSLFYSHKRFLKNEYFSMDNMMIDENFVVKLKDFLDVFLKKITFYHNYDLASGSDVTLCNKIDKPLDLQIFWEKL